MNKYTKVSPFTKASTALQLRLTCSAHCPTHPARLAHYSREDSIELLDDEWLAHMAGGLHVDVDVPTYHAGVHVQCALCIWSKRVADYASRWRFVRGHRCTCALSKQEGVPTCTCAYIYAYSKCIAGSTQETLAEHEKTAS